MDVYFLWLHQDVIDPAKGFIKDDSIILVSYIKVIRWVNEAMTVLAVKMYDWLNTAEKMYR